MGRGLGSDLGRPVWILIAGGGRPPAIMIVRMWKTIAEALGLNIPGDQLDRISPVLDALWRDTRRALDRDLSAVEPAITFRPDLGVEP
jgi:hypothetical protein